MNLSRGLWVLVGGLLAFGVICFVFGLIGDLHGWWTSLGFVSNVMAGVTSACFGIPFAVVVLRRLQRYLDANAGKREIQELNESNVSYLLRLVNELVDGDSEETLREAERLVGVAAANLDEIVDIADTPGAHVDAVRVSTAQSSIDSARAFVAQTRLASENNVLSTWSAIGARWRFIFQELVPRTVAAGINSVYPDVVVARLQELLARQNPFMHLHDMAFDGEWDIKPLLEGSTASEVVRRFGPGIGMERLRSNARVLSWCEEAFQTYWAITTDLAVVQQGLTKSRVQL